MVRKIVAAPQGAATLDEMTRAFESLRIRGNWYRLDTLLRTMLQRLSDITTYELELQLTSASIVFDVIAIPNEISPYRTRIMVN